MRPVHPRPNPIVAAMYTLRDMEVDVIVVHGPSGCGFMASRMLEEAGVRVLTSGMTDNDLVFGGADTLVGTLKAVKERFGPRTVAIVGTCVSSVIGEDTDMCIKRADIGCNVFSVFSHGCMGDNTEGAIKAVEAGRNAGIISPEEAERQITVMRVATALERERGMAARQYLEPVRGPTKLNIAKRINKTLASGGKIGVAMIAKKELAYRFADIFLALKEASDVLGGEVFTVANLDKNKGLPRIRRYAEDISSELESKGVVIDKVVGGLDEYALIGEEVKTILEASDPDLMILCGIPHAYPNPPPEAILITDQPRQLANYLDQGYEAVGEISSHSMVMGTRKIVPLETGDTIRDLLRDTG